MVLWRAEYELKQQPSLIFGVYFDVEIVSDFGVVGDDARCIIRCVVRLKIDSKRMA